MASPFDFLKVALLLPGKLTEEEEFELLKQFQAGDMQAYSKLRLSLRPLVEKTIYDVMPSSNEISASNLKMRADVELPKILQNFDPTRGVKLKTYLLNDLKGRLGNAVKENISGPYVPRNIHPDLHRYKQAIREAEMQFGRNPTEDQIRQYYPETEATQPFDKIKHYHVNSFLSDAVYGDDEDGDGLTFKDQFTDGMSISNDDLLADMFEEEEQQMVQSQFNPTEQLVIDRVTKEGQPFVQVALSLGMSTGEVRKIMRKWHDLTQNQSI